jgi:hypothetical protein
MWCNFTRFSNITLTAHDIRFVKKIVNSVSSQIPWSTVLLENLIASRLVKKFPVFYGTRRFITVFTRARSSKLYSARWIQSASIHPISLTDGLVSSYLSLGTPNDIFLSGFPTKILYLFIILHAYYMYHQSRRTWFDRHNNISYNHMKTGMICTTSSRMSWKAEQITVS